MGIGPNLTQPQVNAVLAAIAQDWVDVAARSEALWTQLNGLGGLTWLETAPPGYSPADAQSVMTLAGQLNQCAGLVSGQGVLAQAFNFGQAFAIVLNPQTLTSG